MNVFLYCYFIKKSLLKVYFKIEEIFQNAVNKLTLENVSYFRFTTFIFLKDYHKNGRFRAVLPWGTLKIFLCWE